LTTSVLVSVEVVVEMWCIQLLLFLYLLFVDISQTLKHRA